MTRLLAVAAALTALLTTACTEPPQAPEPDPRSYVLDRVLSACDEHGNRVYRVSGSAAAFDVVGGDPTCQETP